MRPLQPVSEAAGWRAGWLTHLVVTRPRCSWVSSQARQPAGRRAYQVSQGVGVVKAGVAGGSDDLRQVVGRQAEVGHLLKAAVLVLQVHPVVLQVGQPG